MSFEFAALKQDTFCYDCPGLLKRLAHSINVRVKMDWLGSLMIFVYGYKHAEVIILDYCLEDTK